MHPYIYPEAQWHYRKGKVSKMGKTSFAACTSSTSATGIWTGCTESYGSAKVEVKPAKAKVEIEELDSNLVSGCRISPLTAAPLPKSEKPPAWPCVFYTTVNDNNWLEKDTFSLSVESYVKDEDKIKPDEIWYPFTCQDVESCALIEAVFPKLQKGKKYHKAVQRFVVRLQPPEDEKKAHVPYIQFHCGAKWARHTGAVFKEGDLITIVIRHPKYPLHWPNPPLITVVPRAEQTFVPMLPKQKMVIVTDAKEQVVDFKAHNNSTIRSDGTVDAEYSRQCSYFACTKPSPSSEIIFINQKKKKKQNKKVVIPFVEKEVRCPVILNPLKDAVIYSQNIDGFVIRFWKESYHPITIMAGTPIRGVHTSENAQYIERRFEIEKKRPFFYLSKKEHSWVIR